MASIAVSEPIAPQTLQETRVRKGLLVDLALKLLVLEGDVNVIDLAERICLSVPITDELCQALRKEHLCEVKGSLGRYYRIGATDRGRALAAELLSRNHYVGPAPVRLPEYDNRVHSQSIEEAKVTPEDMARALNGLVLEEDLVMRLGAAASSGASTFLSGPSGTGKTSIANRMRLIYRDAIWIPYAVEIEGQIISVFDGTVHRKMRSPASAESDRRWVLCERPCVVAGGELSAQMLELQFHPITKFYSAPLQMKANNGVLVLDDFGRQAIEPEALLNRWLTPLDRRVDYLSLAGGVKFPVPFDVLVVFATNLDPHRLADSAFQRRIPNKITLDYAPPKQFIEIFRRECELRMLSPEEGLAEWLVEYLATEMKQPLRHSHPKDILQQIVWTAGYQGVEPSLTKDALKQACRNCFPALE